MKGFWTCRRRVDGRLCMERNPNRKQLCAKCGGRKPSKRRPRHMAALDITYEEFVVLNGGERCAICLRERSEKDRRLDRDHDHAAGRPRGLLCHRCNRVLQSWMTAEWCWAAWHYLVRYRLIHEGRFQWFEEDRGHDTPCWIWARATSDRGYAVIRHEGQTLYVHRLMCAGPIPDGYEVDHLCRQRECIRPEHLEAVTPAVNTRRGRAAKLTESDVREIRQRREAGETTVALGKEFGVHSSQISRVARGQFWKESA